MAIDPYMLDIAEKDVSSARLAELALPTLQTEFVHQVVPGKNGLSFLTVPPGYAVVGHSSGGNHSILDPEDYARSVIIELKRQAERIGATPVAMADVIDARSTDLDFVNRAGIPLAEEAQRSKIAILNGELAKYGDMMNCACNISGAMLSLLPLNSPLARLGLFDFHGTKYFSFNPNGNFVWLNSDGTGTNTLINSRFRKFNLSIDNAFAMLLDDRAKFGGGAIAALNILETNTTEFPVSSMERYANFKARQLGITSVLQHEFVGNRLRGPHGEHPVYNISGTLISLVDEGLTTRMPKPREGDYLITIKGNGRSNGFTDRRLYAVRMYGNDWHLTEEGQDLGEFLTKPSIIFYPAFKHLITEGLASAVSHASGGSFRDKLAKQISKYGLYCEVGIEDGSLRFFSPDKREEVIAREFETKNSYAKFPMGNEGWVFSSNPQKAIAYLASQGLEAKVVARLERSPDVSGLRFRAYNNEIVDYTERKAA